MITTLQLSNYRNHVALELRPQAQFVLISGPNGSGKTNILEALSLLAPGRGLRGAKLSDITQQNSDTPWAIYAELTQADLSISIGTALAAPGESNKRLVKLNPELQKSQLALASAARMLWLTPQMEPVILSGTTARRQYIDRIAFYFNPAHAQLVSQYEKTLRERSKLLSQPSYDPSWCRLLEERLATDCVSIVTARAAAVELIMQAMHQIAPSFPHARLLLTGGVERLLAEQPSDAVATLTEMLSAARIKDQYSGHTSFGAHRSDLEIFHQEQNQPFAQCSTGEQKALLLALLLAQTHASLRRGHCPILLLDEVAVHLDTRRREALYAELTTLPTQCWLTATDSEIFTPLTQVAEHVRLSQEVVS